MPLHNIKTTKFGKAMYPHLQEADYKFQPLGLYHVKLVISKEDAEHDIKVINEVISNLVADVHKAEPNKTDLIKRAPLPYLIEGDKVTFNFKMKASGINSRTKESFTQKPLGYNHDLSPLLPNTKVWSDSILRVTYEPIGYSMSSTGIGCTLRLKSYQVKTLVTGTSTDHGFEIVEPGETAITQANNNY